LTAAWCAAWFLLFCPAYSGVLFAQELPAAEGASGTAVPGTDTPGTARTEDPFFFTEAGETPRAAPAPAFAVLRMILVLALVAALIYLAVYGLRRLGRPRPEQNPHLKILASAHLGNGRSVHVLSVGKGAWLVGSGEGGVNHIADITDQEAVDAMTLDASRRSAETQSIVPVFQTLLARFSGGLSGKEQDRLDNMRRRRERFKRF
jgi:flagellar protein FliO/FliZ